MRAIAVVLMLLIVVAIGWIGLSYWRFSREIAADTGRLAAESQPVRAAVTEAMLAHLPPAAQRYLRFAGIVGQPVPRLIRLTQKGRIRSSAADNWMSFEADETYSTNPPGFVWRASLPTKAAPVVLGRDEYLDGEGSILMKMLAIVPVADERGGELAEAGLMRYLNEIMWFPAALLGPNVVISARDDNSFTATLIDRGLTARAVFFVDDEGRLTTFRAQRYNTTTRSIETWETPVSGYRGSNGLNLPTMGSAVWKLGSGDFTYIDLEVGSVVYE